ncbi:unnamed protein product [Pleuronectes platessa]|uniref:Uncharacterized protein n=1 Tax=Pleuronectes platessa TaxID=8262 RepID=A0A9N7VFE1_PLEPL|nr:unnamed protein product [Pleuronectes platessa]
MRNNPKNQEASQEAKVSDRTIDTRLLCRLRMLQSLMSRNENPWDHLSPVSQNQREEEDVGGCPKKGRFCCF